jgi:hypothetical protein
MEKTAKYIVFRHKDTGAYLTNYKNEGSLVYEANCTKQIRHAKTMSFEAFEEQRKHMKLLAKALDCEILVVEATYDLKHLNGEDVKEVEPTVNGKRIVDILHEVAQEMGLDKAGE